MSRVSEKLFVRAILPVEFIPLFLSPGRVVLVSPVGAGRPGCGVMCSLMFLCHECSFHLVKKWKTKISFRPLDGMCNWQFPVEILKKEKHSISHLFSKFQLVHLNFLLVQVEVFFSQLLH